MCASVRSFGFCRVEERGDDLLLVGLVLPEREAKRDERLLPDERRLFGVARVGEERARGLLVLEVAHDLDRGGDDVRRRAGLRLLREELLRLGEVAPPLARAGALHVLAHPDRRLLRRLCLARREPVQERGEGVLPTELREDPLEGAPLVGERPRDPLADRGNDLFAEARDGDARRLSDVGDVRGQEPEEARDELLRHADLRERLDGVALEDGDVALQEREESVLRLFDMQLAEDDRRGDPLLDRVVFEEMDDLFYFVHRGGMLTRKWGRGPPRGGCFPRNWPISTARQGTPARPGGTSRSEAPMSTWSGSTSDMVEDHVEVGNSDVDMLGEHIGHGRGPRRGRKLPCRHGRRAHQTWSRTTSDMGGKHIGHGCGPRRT